jgi:glycosyltransferase involved in cell wall biosynthesis
MNSIILINQNGEKMSKFGIVMTTYMRQDNSSLKKLKRSLQSILDQTYKNWKLFLIGDNYEDKNEFLEVCKLIPEDKITFINLPYAAERDSGKFVGKSLWCSAGANASNVGIEQSIKEGYEIHCHLDDDDIWLPYHLEMLNIGYTNFPESVFVYTNAYYVDRNNYARLFPTENVSKLLDYNNLLPRPEKLIHSSASWKLNEIPFRHENTLEQGRVFPGDAHMWERINKFCKKNNLKTLYIPLTTVIKDSEGYQMKN